MKETEGTFTDPRDGKEYKTVKIGEQVWMAQNLAYKSNGSKCSKYYDNDATNGDRYGLLYNWEAAIDACPPNWHLPSQEEWQTLVDFAGGFKIAGKKLKAKSGWDNYEGKTGNGTDDFGFSALPSGLDFGEPIHRKYLGLWWSFDECNDNSAYDLKIMYSDESAMVKISDKRCSLNVRCVQDSNPMEQEELCLGAVKHDGRALEYVPENLKTEEMCFEAVKNWTIEYLPQMLAREDFDWGRMIKRLQRIFKYVPEEFKATTVERCLKAIDKAVDKTRDALNMCLDPFPYK